MTYADWRGRFLEAIDETLYPAAWLDWLVETEQAKCWANNKAAILVEIREYPSGVREVHGLVAACNDDGSPQDIRALVPSAEAWGREYGATLGVIESSPSWAKIMRADGYEIEQVRIVKRL